MLLFAILLGPQGQCNSLGEFEVLSLLSQRIVHSLHEDTTISHQPGACLLILSKHLTLHVMSIYLNFWNDMKSHQNFFKAIRIMYEHMYVKLTLGEEERTIPYTIGILACNKVTTWCLYCSSLLCRPSWKSLRAIGCLSGGSMHQVLDSCQPKKLNVDDC